jgi:pimeloyl-ACP methyl ester carboxylesterase
MVETEIAVASSPLAPGVTPVTIHVRDVGRGEPLVVLHGGWGYAIYPFDRQIAALCARRRFVIPDRTGYGGSMPLDSQRPDFHQRAAEETIAVLDAMGIGRAVLWGHSDGAVIALRLGLMAPERVDAIVAEATHFFREKPRSREFFETMRDAPERLGDRVAATLEREHGARWRALLSTNGDAWLRIAEEASSTSADLYDGRLADLAVRTLFVHGRRDPRTEPGEIEALCAAVPGVELAMFEKGGHSPHSEDATADDVARAVSGFLR